MKGLKNIGPGAMVAAAFIGPGTVTTASLAGSSFGFTLLWAVVFSIVATLLLQEMASRLGIVGRLGLGEAIRKKIKSPVFKIAASVLVISAIFIGNAAYEAGNITGAVLGFDQFEIAVAGLSLNPLVPGIGLLAFAILMSGKYRLIEGLLVFLVSIMSIVFMVSAILVQPDLSQVVRGIFVPTLPDNALLMVIGLIGTTVVPYNLFLHASSVKLKWTDVSHLSTSWWDTLISVIIGGLITLSIVITSSVALHGSNEVVTDAGDLARQLTPLLGKWSTLFISIGFFAAGLSSAVTAPLAAAFATSEILGWKDNLKSKRFRFVWMTVLLLGVFFSSWGFKPLLVILFAQIANGLLLPVTASFLLWAMNDKLIMGKHANSNILNALTFLVILITLVLGAKSVLGALNII